MCIPTSSREVKLDIMKQLMFRACKTRRTKSEQETDFLTKISAEMPPGKNSAKTTQMHPLLPGPPPFHFSYMAGLIKPVDGFQSF